MKSKLLIFIFLLITSLNGFAQGNRILLEANTDYNTAVSLVTKDGKGTGVKLPVILNWDTKNDLIQVEIKNIKTDNPLYLFSGLISFKDVKKTKKEVSFSKEIIKTASPKKKVGSVCNEWLINAKTDETTKAKIFNLQDPPGAILKFKIINSNDASCSILMKIYLASKFSKGSKTGILIESIAEIKLDLDLKGPCQDAELKNIISLLSKKTKEIYNNAIKINAEKIELAEMSISKVKNLKPKPANKDKRINSIADEKYIKYSNCNILLEVISEYNTFLDSYENAINSYNNLLEERRKDIPYTPVNNCQSLKSANEKLMNLYYKIEQSDKKVRSSFQSEYDNIVNQVEINESCKEYAAYKEWCKGIEKLIKK